MRSDKHVELFMRGYIAEIPYLYQRITTNSGPSNSVLVSLEQTRWPLSEYYEVALFRDSNSNAQVKAFFAERSDGERRWISNKKEWISYRTKSGDGYDVSFSQPSHRILEKAGMFCVALPHGRDEKVQQLHSSGFKTESAAADLQSDS
jgi:hypothetical protein